MVDGTWPSPILFVQSSNLTTGMYIAKLRLIYMSCFVSSRHLDLLCDVCVRFVEIRVFSFPCGDAWWTLRVSHINLHCTIGTWNLLFDFPNFPSVFVCKRISDMNDDAFERDVEAFDVISSTIPELMLLLKQLRQNDRTVKHVCIQRRNLPTAYINTFFSLLARNTLVTHVKLTQCNIMDEVVASLVNFQIGRAHV